MIEPGAEFLARSPVALSAGSPRHTAWLRPTACRPRSMTTCLFRAGPEQTFSLPEASPPAGRVQNAQYGQSAAIVIAAIDHDVVGAHHDFTGAAYSPRFVELWIERCIVCLGLEFLVQLKCCAEVVFGDVVEDVLAVSLGHRPPDDFHAMSMRLRKA